jgi:hypothetical protein
MKEIKDTGLKYVDGNSILEGDDVIFEYYEFGAMPEKIECKIEYKNAAFYVVSNLIINNKPAIEKTIASILENNAQIPSKHPMNITKINK